MMMKKMCVAHKLAWLLLIVGGLNWGLVALGYNVVDAGSLLAKIVYGLVGLSAIAMLSAGKCCMKCGMCKDGMCKDDHCDDCKPKDGQKPPMAMPGMDKRM